MNRIWYIDTSFVLLLLVAQVKLQCSFTAIDNADYEGCWVDGEPRKYPYVYGGSGLGNMTVDYCILGCADEGFQYAGLQAYIWCHCGDDPYLTIGTHPQAPQWECNTPCNANPSQMCGGGWRLAIYKTNYRSDNAIREYKTAYIGQSITAYPLSTETVMGTGLRAIYYCAQSCTNTPQCKAFSHSSTSNMCYKFKGAKLCDTPTADINSSVFYLL